MRGLGWLRGRLLVALGVSVSACADGGDGTVKADAQTDVAGTGDADAQADLLAIAESIVPQCSSRQLSVDGLRCFDAAQLKGRPYFSNAYDGCRGTGSKSYTHLAGPFPPEGCPDIQNGIFQPGLIYTPQDGHLIGDFCCYRYCQTGYCGRPFTVADQARTAPLAEGSAWSAAAGTAEPSAHSAALAAAWRADALDEHASVASFGRFVLELLAFGAPPELLRDALTAAADEVRHAQVCFGVATQLDGQAQGPGPLDLADMQLATSLAEAAAAAVREGCVGETLAAAHAAAASRQTTDPALAQALAAIADDEARHAALAWRFVQWACGQGDPAVGPAVRAAFAAALAAPPTARTADLALAAVPAVDQHAAGRLPAGEATALYRAVLADVVGPCARVLVGWVVRAA
jgi:hypothetical protein